MRARHPGPGELVAGAGGLLLLLAMFLPWFGLNGRARVPGSGEVITVGRGEIDAWEAFSGIDVLLLLVAALAIGLLVLSLLSTPPPELAVAVSGASAAAALLIVYRLIDVPDLPIGDPGDTTYETGRPGRSRARSPRPSLLPLRPRERLQRRRPARARLQDPPLRPPLLRLRPLRLRRLRLRPLPLRPRPRRPLPRGPLRPRLLRPPQPLRRRHGLPRLPWRPGVPRPLPPPLASRPPPARSARGRALPSTLNVRRLGAVTTAA
jgi:hypothetical protein